MQIYLKEFDNCAIDLGRIFSSLRQQHLVLLPDINELGMRDEFFYGTHADKLELNPKSLAARVVLDIIILRSFMPDLDQSDTDPDILSNDEIDMHIFMLLNRTVLEIKQSFGPVRLNIDIFKRFFIQLLNHLEIPWDKPMVHDRPGMLGRYRKLLKLLN